MKVSEFIKILMLVPDDYELMLNLQTTLPKEVLKKMQYPYPCNYEPLSFSGYDCGHSDGTVHLFFEKEDGGNDKL